jgi:hypothetical protein
MQSDLFLSETLMFKAFHCVSDKFFFISSVSQFLEKKKENYYYTLLK